MADDAGQVWQDTYERVVALARSHDLSATVPATPDWTGQDLVAHMAAVGIGHVDGTAPAEGHPPEWTAQGVAERRGRSLDAVLDEWAAAAPRIRELVASEQPGLVVDIATHEQDLRGSLHVAGARDGAAADACRDFYVGGFVDAVADLPALTVQTGSGRWDLGQGGSVGVLHVDPYELVRAAAGRRSEAQVRAWPWPVDDPSPWVDRISRYGALHDVDLVE